MARTSEKIVSPIQPEQCLTGRRYARAIVYHVCCLAGSARLLEDQQNGSSLRAAIERFDTPTLFNWMIGALTLQGISDKVATGYWQKYGGVTWSEIDYRLSRNPSCPKLRSYWHFHGCRYNKNSRSCAEPEHFHKCPLPKHRLRNGRLNQTAYSLFFFMRDIAESDFVSWADGRLLSIDFSHRDALIERMREALLAPLRNVFGAADKTLAMVLSTVLLSAQDARDHWHVVGSSLVAVDSLVHNFLHRTGVLRRFHAEHAYGAACLKPKGCGPIIRAITSTIDARKFNIGYPAVFPRFVQHAIWRFCAQEGLSECNGNRINDAKRCANRFCPLFVRCDRIRLGRRKSL